MQRASRAALWCAVRHTRWSPLLKCCLPPGMPLVLSHTVIHKTGSRISQTKTINSCIDISKRTGLVQTAGVLPSSYDSSFLHELKHIHRGPATLSTEPSYDP